MLPAARVRFGSHADLLIGRLKTLRCLTNRINAYTCAANLKVITLDTAGSAVKLENITYVCITTLLRARMQIIF